MTTALDQAMQRLAEARRQAATPDQMAPVAKLAGVVQATAREVDKAHAPRGGFDDAGAPGASPGYSALLKMDSVGNDFVRRFKRWNDDVLFAGTMLRARDQSLDSSVHRVMKGVPEFSGFLERELGGLSSELQKAIAGSTSGAGAEFIPTLFSTDLADLIREGRAVPRLFNRFVMTQPVMRLPQLTADMVAFKVSETTSNPTNVLSFPVSNFGTANIVFTPVKLVATGVLSDEFTMDSIVPAIPLIRTQVQIASSGAVETATVNGSTNSPHPDFGVGSTSPETAWNGLRATCMGADFLTTTGTTALDGTNMTIDNLLSLITKQGRFGTNPADSAWITSAQGMVKLMGVRDTNNQQVLITADKFGPQYALSSGALGKLFGRDVVVSDFVKTTLNAAGIVPDPAGTKTQVILANKTAFLYGDRQELTIESDRIIGVGQTIFAAGQRIDYKRVRAGQTSADRPVTIGLSVDTV